MEEIGFVNATPGPLILPKLKEIWNVVQELSYEQTSAAGSGGIGTGTKNEVKPV